MYKESESNLIYDEVINIGGKFPLCIHAFLISSL